MLVLAFIQYLGKFVPNVTDMRAPLRNMTGKDAEWKCTGTEEKSVSTDSRS